MSGFKPSHLSTSWWIPLILSCGFVAANIWLSIQNERLVPSTVWPLESGSIESEPPELKTSTRDSGRDANLRNEINRLRALIESRKETIILLRQTPEPNFHAPPSIEDEFLTPEAWRHKGQTTPQDSLESLLHASTGGDIDTLKSILFMDEETTKFAAALFDVVPHDLKTEIGDVASFIAMMTVDAVPDESVSIPSVFPLDDQLAAVILTRPGVEKGPHRITNFSARRESNTDPWQITVPFEAIERYHAKLLGPLTADESNEASSPDQENEPEA